MRKRIECVEPVDSCDNCKYYEPKDVAAELKKAHDAIWVDQPEGMGGVCVTDGCSCDSELFLCCQKVREVGYYKFRGDLD